MEDVTVVRRCVVDGQVPFADFCGFVTELIPMWKFVKEYVRYTGARHLESSTDRVSFLCCFFPLVLSFPLFVFPFSLGSSGVCKVGLFC